MKKLALVSAMVLTVSCSAGSTSFDKTSEKKSLGQHSNAQANDLQTMVQHVIGEINAGNDPAAYKWSFCEPENDKTYCVGSVLTFANGKSFTIENRGNYGETSAQSAYSGFKEGQGEKVAAKFSAKCWAIALKEALDQGAQPESFSQMFSDGNLFFGFAAIGMGGFDLKTGECYATWEH